MTNKQALNKAIKLMGKNAGVQKPCEPFKTYSIGVVVMGCMFEVTGSGLTWEEAFRNWEETGMRRKIK